MAAFYDDPHFDYRKYWQGREYEDKAERIAIRKLLKLIPQKKKLLDIGGGFGRLTPEYAPLFEECVLVDPSENLLKQAKKLCRTYPNLSIKKGVAEKLPEKGKSFDAVIAIRIFHHLENPQTAIREIYRVLKPGGFLILEFANKIRFKNIIQALVRLDFKFLTDHNPVKVGQKNTGIPFLSYHPNHVKTLLLTNGFQIIKSLSVSNLRNPFIKKIIPLKALLFLESVFSWASARFFCLKFWGPSIFVLAQKKK